MSRRPSKGVSGKGSQEPATGATGVQSSRDPTMPFAASAAASEGLQEPSDPQIFTFAPGVRIRALMRDAEPWFVASEIAQALGYRDAANLVRMLDDDDICYSDLSIRSGNGVHQYRAVTLINESGFYTAVVRSNRLEAKAFRRWVTATVLPSIRTHGVYAKGAEQLPDPAQAAFYAHVRGQLAEALRRYDRLTEHDHWRSLAKRPELSQSAAAHVAGHMGLPLSIVEAMVAQGVDGGLKALRSSSS
jgi:prophage antirepressor-like protein